MAPGLWEPRLGWRVSGTNCPSRAECGVPALTPGPPCISSSSEPPSSVPNAPAAETRAETGLLRTTNQNLDFLGSAHSGAYLESFPGESIMKIQDWINTLQRSGVRSSRFSCSEAVPPAPDPCHVFRDSALPPTPDCWAGKMTRSWCRCGWTQASSGRNWTPGLPGGFFGG